MKNTLQIIILFFLSIPVILADSNLTKERNLIKSERNNLAIGWRDNLGYEVPKPGTYDLYKIRI